MKLSNIPRLGHRGALLIESIIAVGVLSIAIPLVFGAMAESGKCGMDSAAETRGAWMIQVCMEEIRASREGCPRYFTASKPGQVIPPEGEVWALAFSPEGKPVGKVDKADYDKGVRKIDGMSVRYIACVRTAAVAEAGSTPMLGVRISLEYPAATPAGKRQNLDFHTRIP